jgi:hypothetical protein
VTQVKSSRYRPKVAQRVGRGIAVLFLDLGARRGWVVSITPQPLYPRERPGTHCTGGWVGLRAGLDAWEKSRPPPGFDPRTVQPVASRYTDWTTRPTRSVTQTLTNSVFRFVLSLLKFGKCTAWISNSRMCILKCDAVTAVLLNFEVFWYTTPCQLVNILTDVSNSSSAGIFRADLRFRWWKCK